MTYEAVRLAFREQLLLVLEEAGESGSLYYQSPGKHLMQYPCIVYKRKNQNRTFADNRVYTSWPVFEFTCITGNALADYVGAVEKIMPSSKLLVSHVVDGLYHYTFETTYYI